MSDKSLLEKPSRPALTKKEVLMTLLAISILIGFYLCQDEPQALQVQLKEPPYNLTGSQFNFIYFFTNIPNVVLPVLSGMLIDKIGVRKSGIVFSLGVFVAQAVVTFSIYWRADLVEPEDDFFGWYYLLLGSRALLGICGENIHIVQAAMVSIAVSQEHISTVLGLCMSVPLMFTSLNSLVSTEVYDATKNMVLPFAIGYG